MELMHRKANGPLQWFIGDIVYDDWSSTSTKDKRITFEASETLKQNGTMWAHVWLVRHGANPVSLRKSPPSAKNFYVYSLHPITKYMKNDLSKLKKNLLSQEASNIEVPSTPTIVSHWKGNYTISLVTDVSAYPQGGIPPQLIEYFSFTDDGSQYFPIVWENDFWLLREDFSPLNSTVSSLTLDLHFEPIGFMKFGILTQMSVSLGTQSAMLGSDEGESELKRIFIDNPPWLLVLTFSISIVHSVLDILAFKNEISFWKDRKSMKGLSLRTIYFNIVTNVIVLLYLLDNDTNWMILLSAGSATIIEMWKITRAAHVKFVWLRRGIPWLSITEKQSYASTKKYDDEAMKYLYWAMFPLIILYAGYSLVYETHKSWYSFVVSTLAGCVYTFGFIMMTPQLFINYRLKSVAHLPWRAFVYKGINTFIDDMFAFIIRMPTLHRLRCLRDDVIFVIYLYQRWIYPVDPNRVEVLDGEMGESADREQIEQEKIAFEKEQAEKEKKEPTNEPVSTEAAATEGKLKLD